MPDPPPGSDVEFRVEDGVVTIRFHSPPLLGWVGPVLATGLALLCVSSFLMVLITTSYWLRADWWIPPLYVNAMLGIGLLVAAGVNVSFRPQAQRLTMRIDRDRLAVREPWRVEGARGAWAKRDVSGVCLTPAAQVLAEAPQMELRLGIASAPPVFLLAGRSPRELMWAADVLRRLLDLPGRRDHRVGWLRTRAPQGSSPLEGRGFAPPAASVAVPVLAYATPGTRARALDPFIRWGDATLVVSLGPAAGAASAALTLTPDELSLEAEGNSHRWRCDDVYAVFASFAAEGEPPELFVCWAAPHAAAVDRVLGGTPEELLRQLADLLNEAMGLRPS